ncbi:MAG: RNA polymerase sigma factor [Bacteroidales bacterium]
MVPSEESHTFSQLVDEHTETLLSWAKFKIPDYELARDLVQETFLATYHHLNTLRAKAPIKPGFSPY